MKKISEIALVLALLLSACSGGGGGNDVSPASDTQPSFSNFQTSSFVVGQPTFTSNGNNQEGSVGPKTLYQPGGSPAVVNGTLFLPDYMNNRVLGFNALPAASNPSADFALGQANLMSGGRYISATTMDGPTGVAASDGKLFVTDGSNNRVLIWNNIPAASGVAANVAVGQSTLSSWVSACTRTGMNFPTDTAVVGGKLIIVDGSNNRVLIWNSIPTSNGAPADVVLGQGDFTHCQYNDDNQDKTADSGATGRTLNYPSGVWSDGTRLIVADNGNSRVLIWNSIPAINFTPADLVIGQNDLTHNAGNDDAQAGAAGLHPTARTLSYPVSVDSDGLQLVISDTGNNRVLIWNAIPTANFAAADIVLGQGDFVHGASNDDAQTGTDKWIPTARTLFGPEGLYIAGSKLFVGDKLNNRYLVFEKQ